MLRHERLAWRKDSRVVGVDEAGRGPLAGPVVAAAVFIPRQQLESEAVAALDGLTDSKRLSPPKREEFFRILRTLPGVSIGVGAVGPRTIDRKNILEATFEAMRRALSRLGCGRGVALVDGPRAGDLGWDSRCIVDGDSASLLIAAASVVAKVVRDRMLERLDRRYPRYGFARHKGYATENHLLALKRWGPCPEHRMSFRPLCEWFGPRQMNLSLEEAHAG
ncbi:MAG TPA: ribonuclease HII [Kiritimatiellae bacterium]|nr:ribonuclease HII [Kiritimatiellia bacterium]